MTSNELTLFFVWAWFENSRAHERKAAYQKSWVSRNPEKKRANDAESYARHRAVRQRKILEYSEANPDKPQAAKRAYYARNIQLCKDRAKAHRGTAAGREYMRGWMKRKTETDLGFKLRNRVGARLWHALRAQTAKKVSGTVTLLGCSVSEFKEKISALLPEGWTWENYGKVWELDHKKPCASFDLTDPEQQKLCFHWSNYQPLTPFENRSKGAKV